jgi:hypothetical protein
METTKMPTHYLYGTILTNEAVAANNRGDNIGNTTTLQKVFHQDDVYTSVSAEAIRFALRYRFQLEAIDEVNRSYDSSTGMLEYQDEKRTRWNPESEVFIDDDFIDYWCVYRFDFGLFWWENRFGSNLVDNRFLVCAYTFDSTWFELFLRKRLFSSIACHRFKQLGRSC